MRPIIYTCILLTGLSASAFARTVNATLTCVRSASDFVLGSPKSQTSEYTEKAAPTPFDGHASIFDFLGSLPGLSALNHFTRQPEALNISSGSPLTLGAAKRSHFGHFSARKV
jgi:hypothetical protein